MQSVALQRAENGSFSVASYASFPKGCAGCATRLSIFLSPHFQVVVFFFESKMKLWDRLTRAGWMTDAWHEEKWHVCMDSYTPQTKRSSNTLNTQLILLVLAVNSTFQQLLKYVAAFHDASSFVLDHVLLLEKQTESRKKTKVWVSLLLFPLPILALHKLRNHVQIIPISIPNTLS